MVQRAVVLGPIQASWDKGAFAKPIVNWLSNLHYEVHLVDCMLFSQEKSPDSVLSRIHETIADKVQALNLVVGYAFGGLAAAHLANRFPDASVLGLSSPLCLKDDLQAKIQEMCDLLDQNKSEHALALLHRWVGDTQVVKSGSQPLNLEVAQQISRMFHVLLDLSKKPISLPYRKKPLFLYGQDSKLVTCSHLPERLRPFMQIVPSAGMRLLSDAPNATISFASEWILKNDFREESTGVAR